jgi:nucleotide-binding universal stress UspA family protein
VGAHRKEGNEDMNAAPIVVGVDGSEESRLALRWAFEYAQMSGAPVEVIIAWEIPPSYGWAPSYDDVDFEKKAQETVEEIVRGVLGDDALVTCRVERGHPAPILVVASKQAQLLVVGSRGHGAFAEMLLGSVSQHCVHHARCPVVVIRRPEGGSRPSH